MTPKGTSESAALALVVCPCRRNRQSRRASSKRRQTRLEQEEERALEVQDAEPDDQDAEPEDQDAERGELVTLEEEAAPPASAAPLWKRQRGDGSAGTESHAGRRRWGALAGWP